MIEIKAAIAALIAAASIALTLVLAFAIYRALRRLGKRATQCEASIQAESAQLTNAINELKHNFAEMRKEEAQTLENLETGNPGLTEIARTKILKMHRVGHAPEIIAEKLRLPKGEVHLFLKVHHIVIKPYQGAGAAADRLLREKRLKDASESAIQPEAEVRMR